MGHRPGHFQDALRFLLRAWRGEEGLPGEMREYLVGLASEALEEADERSMGHFDRMLASDVLRLHRSSVETAPDALTRCRLVSAQERALSKLGLHRVRGRMTDPRRRQPSQGWRTPPTRVSERAAAEVDDDRGEAQDAGGSAPAGVEDDAPTGAGGGSCGIYRRS